MNGVSSTTRRAVVVLLIGSATGCARPRLPAKTQPATTPDQGQVAFEFVADPTVSPPRKTEHQEFVAPDPIGRLPLPLYPEAALAAGAGPTSVGLRIVIGSDGFVAEVQDSPLARSTPSPFAREFRAAAEVAVRRWRFSPGQIVQYEDGEDLDGDGRPDSRREVGRDPTRVFYDVRFDFRIIEGRGDVRSSASGR